MKKIIVVITMALMSAQVWSQDPASGGGGGRPATPPPTQSTPPPTQSTTTATDTTTAAVAADDTAAAGVADAAIEQLTKDKERIDKKVAEGSKGATKAKNWMAVAQLYEQIALNNSSVDSNAAKTAQDAYKKVVELDKTKDGEPGKRAEEASKILAGEDTTSQLYNAFLKQAVEKFQAKNNKSALEFFTAAQELNKKDTTAALYGGITAQALGENEKMTGMFEKYVANGGKDAQIYAALAGTYRQAKKFDEARAVLEKGLAMDGNNKDLNAELVNISLDSGDEEAAAEQLKKVVANDPNNAVNIVNLGILYDNFAMKNTDSIAGIEEKLGMGANSPLNVAKQALEQEQAKQKTFDDEIARLSGEIKKRPRDRELKRQLADVEKSLETSKTSFTDLEAKVKEADPVSPEERASSEQALADLKAKQDEFKKLAAENYTKALEVDPNNYDANYQTGVLYYNEAVEMKKEVDNMSLDEYNQRGKELEGKICGQFKKCQPYFEKALSIKSDGQEAKENLDMVTQVLQQFESKGVACTEP